MVTIRTACLEDAQRLLEIYGYYVENTAISFEYEVPALTEFQERMKRILQRYPYLVAVQDGTILGYAYAGPFHPRAAYQWTAEVTIYVDPECRKCGLGRKLYEALEQRLTEMGILNLYACIGYPEEEDAYLTKNSAEFHTHMGYRLAGRFVQCGYKFNRWYDMVYMEKCIGAHREQQPEPKWFGNRVGSLQKEE